MHAFCGIEGSLIVVWIKFVCMLQLCSSKLNTPHNFEFQLYLFYVYTSCMLLGHVYCTGVSGDGSLRAEKCGRRL